MLKLIATCFLSLLLALPLCAEMTAEQKAQFETKQKIADLQQQINERKAQITKRTSKRSAFYTREEMELIFNDKIIADLQRQIDELKKTQKPNPTHQKMAQAVVDTKVVATKNPNIVMQSKSSKMNESIEQKQAILAELQAELAQLKAQKGIPTSQDSQPQSIQNPSKNKTMTRFDLIKYKLENGIILDPMEQKAMKAAGYDVKALREELQNKRARQNEAMQILRQYIKVLECSEIVVPRLNKESEFLSELGRILYRWTGGFYSFGVDTEFIQAAEEMRKTFYELEYQPITNEFLENESQALVGIAYRFNSLKENIAIMKLILETTLSRIDYLENTEL